jgi:hypothetical protein
MKKFIWLFLIVFNSICFHLMAGEALSKELKTLILIITTDDQPFYKEAQKIWKTYMNSDPDHFEAYFLRGNPDLGTLFEISKNDLTVKTQESLVPGIINKTILGMEALEPRLDEFDYVIRTNLSSFYPFENLRNFLSKLPRKNCYAGISLYQPKSLGLPPGLDNVPFISGAGVILSSDLAKMLIKKHLELDKYKAEMPDDVFLGLFYQKNLVRQIPAQRWDYPTYEGWVKNNHKIEDHAYHFRAKRSYNVRATVDPYEDELLTLKALLKKYYPDLVNKEEAVTM